MAQSSINMEIPLKVTGPDGTILWEGSGIFGLVRFVKNTDTSIITEALHIILDTANSVFVASNSLASSVNAGAAQVFAGKIGSTTPPSSLGFAIAGIPVGGLGPAFAVGSICCAAVAGATGTIGHHCIGAASGLVTSAGGALAVSPVVSPGLVLKPSGVAGGVTDTGVATRMGILVQPHAT